MEQYFRAKKGLYVGIGKDENQVIEADLGLGANNPKLRYNAISDKWEYSNDGTTYVEITEIPSDMFLTGTNDMDDIADGVTYVKTENNLTDDYKNKLDNLTDNYKGSYADDTALKTAYPIGSDGDYATVQSTGTMWIWNVGLSDWADTLNGSTGDMLKADYDTSNKGVDVYNMDNMDDGVTYVKTENNLTDSLKTNYDSAYTHSTIITGNPHSVTKSDVGLGNVVDTDTTNADNISDGTTNAIITLTQETNFETAYSKSHDQNTDTGTSSDDFSIGDGTDTDKTISIDNGDANSPQLKYNASTNTWQYSNDGTTFNDIGTLPSNLVYTDQENTFTQAQIIPSIKPSVDSTTAFQITKADGVTPIMNIDTTNSNVGVGTATPTKPLTVIGDTLIKKTSTTAFEIQNDTETTMFITDTTTGNSGIMTTSPKREFHIHNPAVGADTYLQITNDTTGDASATAGLVMGVTTAEKVNIVNYSDTDMGFYTNGLERFRIGNAGNVTVGGTFGTGTSPFSVVSATPFTLDTTTDIVSRFFSYTTPTFGAELGATITLGGAVNAGTTIRDFAAISGVKENATSYDPSGNLIFKTRKADSTLNEIMRLTSTGNVGIGTTNPSQKLHVAGTTGSVNQYISTGDSGNTGLYFANTYATTPNYAGIQFTSSDDKLRIFNNNTATNHLVIDNTGKVTIGTTYAAPTLDNEVATKKYVDDNSGGGSTLAKLQEIYGLLANQNGVNYSDDSPTITTTIHTVAANSKSFFNFSFTNTTTTAQTIYLLVDEMVIYREELNAGENRNLADVLHQPYFVANTNIKLSATSDLVQYSVNVIDVLDTDLPGFFMIAGSTPSSSQITIKTAGVSTKIKILGEIFCNNSTTPNNIYTEINSTYDLFGQTIGVNQGCLAMLNQGKIIRSNRSYKIQSSSAGLKYLIFGYEG